MKAAKGEYFELLRLVEAADYDRVSRLLRRFKRSDRNDELSFLRSLVGLRVAFKTPGRALDHIDFPAAPPLRASPLVRAEYSFTRGLLRYHRGDFRKGLEDFREAARLFETTGIQDRWLTAQFNVFSGERNADAVTPESALQRLREIEEVASQLKNLRVQGAVARERSYIFFETARFRAAYQEAKMAVRLLARSGPKSDEDLARLQLADCALSLGRAELARLQVEYLVEPLDRRVQFPLAYVKARLDGHAPPPAEESAPKAWAWRCAPTQCRSTTKASLRWERSNGRVSGPGFDAVEIRAGSLEGLLLAQLIDGPRSKALLCEKLWPLLRELRSVDARFYRLVNRLKSKLPGLITSDGQHYRLTRGIELR